MKTPPTLYKRTSTGAIQEWTIAAWEQEVGVGIIQTTYGQVGGKRQTAEEYVREGKNIGRSNETTAVQQAEAEAVSRWEQKLKKGYVQSLEDAQEGKTDAIIAGGVSPMLAQSFEKHPHKIAYPAFVQPKLDGHRCIAVIQDGKATLWSRTRKRITGVPHIERELEAWFTARDSNGPVVLDGELYNHDYKDKFEQLTSLIRSQTPKPGHEVVQYWVYDIVNDWPQEARIAKLKNLGDRFEKIVIVPTETVEGQDELVSVFGAYIDHGFEGLMVRNAQARYKVGGRSYDLQKVKVFEDAEYELVRIEAGKGKMADKAVFVCVTETGEEFKCKLVGRLDDLRKYLDDPEPYIGKLVTVKYQNLSEKGIPRFGVAMRFREDV